MGVLRYLILLVLDVLLVRLGLLVCVNACWMLLVGYICCLLLFVVVAFELCLASG